MVTVIIMKVAKNNDCNNNGYGGSWIIYGYRNNDHMAVETMTVTLAVMGPK